MRFYNKFKFKRVINKALEYCVKYKSLRCMLYIDPARTVRERNEIREIVLQSLEKYKGKVARTVSRGYASCELETVFVNDSILRVSILKEQTRARRSHFVLIDKAIDRYERATLIYPTFISYYSNTLDIFPKKINVDLR